MSNWLEEKKKIQTNIDPYQTRLNTIIHLFTVCHSSGAKNNRVNEKIYIPRLNSGQHNLVGVLVDYAGG